MKPRHEAAQPELPSTETARQFVGGTRTEPYTHVPKAVREGADDHEKIPSLHSGARYYRDGRQEKVQ